MLQAVESFLTESTDTVSTVVATAATPVNPLPVAEATTTESISLWELCMEGGWIMIPLAILSIICIYIFVERWLTIRRASRQDRTFMDRIRDYIHQGELESATRLCERTDTPSGRLIAKGISRIGRPMNDVPWLSKIPAIWRSHRSARAFHGSPPLPQELRCSASSALL